MVKSCLVDNTMCLYTLCCTLKVFLSVLLKTMLGAAPLSICIYIKKISWVEGNSYFFIVVFCYFLSGLHFHIRSYKTNVDKFTAECGNYEF